MIYRVIGALVGLAVIAAALLLFDRDEIMNSTAAPNKKAVAKQPGYSARHAEIVETGRDGRPMYIVRAETVRQIPEAKSVMLETVRMELRDDDGQRWTARADYGQIFQADENVQLTGDVLVSGTLPGSPDTAQIATERLSFDTQNEVVKTVAPVTVNWGGRRLEAKGLVANLKAQTLRLESNVHGNFSD
jgi:lipopolysaccharide export system protein LptC